MQSKRLLHVEASEYMECSTTFYLTADPKLPNSRIEQILRKYLDTHDIGYEFSQLEGRALYVAFYPIEELREPKGIPEHFSAHASVTPMGNVDDEVLRILKEYTSYEILDVSDLV